MTKGYCRRSSRQGHARLLEFWPFLRSQRVGRRRVGARSILCSRATGAKWREASPKPGRYGGGYGVVLSLQAFSNGEYGAAQGGKNYTMKKRNTWTWVLWFVAIAAASGCGKSKKGGSGDDDPSTGGSNGVD